MEEFVRELGNDFCLDDYIIKDREIIFKISSTESEMKCPYCGELSRKVHSIYQRETQDLPLQNKKPFFWLIQENLSVRIRHVVRKHSQNDFLLSIQRGRKLIDWRKVLFILPLS